MGEISEDPVVDLIRPAVHVGSHEMFSVWLHARVGKRDQGSAIDERDNGRRVFLVAVEYKVLDGFRHASGGGGGDPVDFPEGGIGGEESGEERFDMGPEQVIVPIGMDGFCIREKTEEVGAGLDHKDIGVQFSQEFFDLGNRVGAGFVSAGHPIGVLGLFGFRAILFDAPETAAGLGLGVPGCFDPAQRHGATSHISISGFDLAGLAEPRV